jgi:hypothetical protein
MFYLNRVGNGNDDILSEGPFKKFSKPREVRTYLLLELLIFVQIQQVLRIHDILVWVRIRGSRPMTNGYGSWIRILQFSSLAFKTRTKNSFSVY